MDKSLSTTEILQYLKGKTKIVIYPELKKIKNISELLASYKSFVLLYLTGPNYGHFVCVIDHGNRIEFFDSYSIKPDKEFDFINNDKLNGVKYLSKLLYKTKKPIEYNHIKLQQDGDEIATCGRWCALRLLLKDIKLDDFIYMMTNTKMSPDKLVTYLTRNI